MARGIQDVADEVSTLSTDGQEELLEPEPEVEEALLAEVRRRNALFDQGLMEIDSAEEVIADLRKAVLGK